MSSTADPTDPFVKMRRRGVRSSVAFLLCLTFLASAAVQALFGLLDTPATASTIDYSRASMIFDLTFGLIVLIYWVHDRPNYDDPNTPLGITLLGIELGVVTFIVLVGLIFFARTESGFGALFGLAIGYAVRSLWKGKEWALTLMKILTGIGLLVIPILLIFYRVGNPVFPVFQLWYLTRPQVSKFFAQSDMTGHVDSSFFNNTDMIRERARIHFPGAEN